MTTPSPTATVRVHRSLGPPRLLARLLGRAHQPSAARTWPSGHGSVPDLGDTGTDFTAATSPFCSNLRLLLLPPVMR